MYDSELRKAIEAAAELVESAENLDERAMFDVLVNLELVARTAVEKHLVASSIRMDWRSSAPTSLSYH